MPNPNRKVRGRRVAASEVKHDQVSPDLERPQGLKRKREVEVHQEPPVSNITFTESSNNILDESEEIFNNGNTLNSESPFYGLLNEEEQAYFSRANDFLELNDFENREGNSCHL